MKREDLALWVIIVLMVLHILSDVPLVHTTQLLVWKNAILAKLGTTVQKIRQTIQVIHVKLAITVQMVHHTVHSTHVLKATTITRLARIRLMIAYHVILVNTVMVKGCGNQQGSAQKDGIVSEGRGRPHPPTWVISPFLVSVSLRPTPLVTSVSQATTVQLGQIHQHRACQVSSVCSMEALSLRTSNSMT